MPDDKIQTNTQGDGGRGDGPRIRVIRTEAGPEARFELLLVGANPRTGASPQPHDRLLPRWPPTLGPREGVDFIYRIEQGYLKTLLRGRAIAATEEEATDKARQLWNGLLVLLESARGSYAFAPAREAPEDDSTPLPFRVVIEPVGYRITSRVSGTIGFGASDVSGPALVLDYPSARAPQPFDTAVHAAAVCRSRAEIRLSFDCYRLVPQTLECIDAALAELRASARAVHADEGHRVVRDHGILRALEHHLGQCQRQRVGLLVRLSLASDEPPPATLINLIGREALQGRELTWRNASEVRPGSTPRAGPPPEGPFIVDTGGAIDLRGYRPAGTALWATLPSLQALHDSGLPQLLPERVNSLPEQGILLGQIGDGQRARPVRFAEIDRGRHCYLLGATGTGKSTLLFNMLMQDIRRGAGVCLLDPHADLTEQVIDALPAERLQDLILFDPSDPVRAAGLNFLETSRGSAWPADELHHQ